MRFGATYSFICNAIYVGNAVGFLFWSHSVDVIVSGPCLVQRDDGDR